MSALRFKATRAFSWLRRSGMVMRGYSITDWKMSMPFGTYRDLIVWQKSVDLAVYVYRLTRGFPHDERFGVTSQVRRAAMSISNNIAEGHGRATRGEFLNALSVARGSANEVENCLLVSQRLEFVSETAVQPLLDLTSEISPMLAKLRASLRMKRN